MRETDKPLVLITGISGDIGTALSIALREAYRVVGLDRKRPWSGVEWVECDLTDARSVQSALARIADEHGRRIASVVHLAAYFDFTGEHDPKYDAVNVEGTRHLLRALQTLDVEQFVYSGTMLIHQPVTPGERIDESAPIAPKWAYPQSKAAAEAVIAEEHGSIPYVLLHLAGLYDDESAVPTLAHQIARVYERDAKSHLYSGDLRAGQSMVHKEDLVDAIKRTIDRRSRLPADVTILIGEPDPLSYEELQNELGRLIHDADGWPTLSLPAPLAKAGAWLQTEAEPLVPDLIDRGEKPFIRPFMIDMASDHYALDIRRARELLDWQPRHSLRATLPKIVAALKRDPLAWYRAHKITPPRSLEAAEEGVDQPGEVEPVRRQAEREFRAQYRQGQWGALLTAALGTWLLASPATLGYLGTPLAWSDFACGAALVILGLLAMSWRFAMLRWISTAIGIWLLAAPLVFWTPSAAGYLNGTLVGALTIGFAALVRPAPGVAAIARERGPIIPPGWDYTPSSWIQRLPIIALAFLGLYLSRYMAAFQLEHIDGVWEPFFPGSAADPKNGTEEIITSYISEAFPVPDAGLGAFTYMLEILTGIAGSARRWRTMPWLVIAFGIMIVPLGAVSIGFIIIQPILLGTWCTVCLIAAAAMLIQIPYSLDELVATCQFLRRRKRAGRSLLRVFFTGDTDEGETDAKTERAIRDEFLRPPGVIFADMLGGGVAIIWSLIACVAVGLWLMFTRLTLGAEGAMADADHLIGALVITVSISALAEVGRSLRLLNIPLGAALFITPFLYGADLVQTIASLACGLLIIALSLRRGPIRHHYGRWSKLIV